MADEAACPRCGRVRKIPSLADIKALCRTCQGAAVVLDPPGPWRFEGVCGQVDPELWFPDVSQAVQADTARSICRKCPVRIECLTYAIENDEHHGIWGGMTRRERLALMAKLGKRKRLNKSA